ncbi:SDR family NAD(P)-dependent oxidoreductase [Nonomuraea ferruginea]
MIEKSPLAEFTDQVAVVTGGGSGIGRAIAVRYAAGGGNVVVGRRAEPLEETARMIEDFGVSAAVVTCDVRDADALTAAIDGVAAEHGRIDAMVNNAAKQLRVPGREPLARRLACRGGHRPQWHLLRHPRRGPPHARSLAGARS